jgi:GT2 family glycosyltransferase
VSVIVLAWDGLMYTRRCVRSVRSTTDVPYELILVDNGSGPEARRYAREAGDVAVQHDENLGFARGMNSGLEVARGRYVAFVNNDTVLPHSWASRLISTFETVPAAGVVVPSVTAAANPVTVRSVPADRVARLRPFGEAPSGVLYLMETETCRSLGGFDERYRVASGEDLDLAFAVWVNGLEIVHDERVLVEHVGKATASRLHRRRELWERNGRIFLDRWTSEAPGVPRLQDCPPEVWERNRRTAAAAAGWMDRYYTLRAHRIPGQRLLRSALSRTESWRQRARSR